MIGDVYDYNSQRVYIMSGEKRIIIPFVGSQEYQEALKNGMRIGATVVFDNQKNRIIRFL
ncbi:hypothetical protein SAMN05660297_02781 [Natronincola peptidivorans]|uniref:Uncharacterized protein n=1 Tax=Natronincola peptidivorans TaxID=426128 RepID=A0A1I0FG65_9FIRM|nr:hypothetical protein [Natronincola peptidivorans]SET56383.1 hypothetical protein SAMN05660297_02781 [Natronincola peptidivorans]